MFCPTLRTLDLPLDVVHEALHAGLEAVVVLAGQHLGRPVPVQADAAGEQLVELLHPGAAAAEPPAALNGENPLFECFCKKGSKLTFEIFQVTI